MEPRDNEGALFGHDKKGNDKAPDYKGGARVAGVDYDLSAWINTAKASGKKYLKLKLSVKGERRQPAPSQGEQFQQQQFPAAQDDLPQPDEPFPF